MLFPNVQKQASPIYFSRRAPIISKEIPKYSVSESVKSRTDTLHFTGSENNEVSETLPISKPKTLVVLDYNGTISKDLAGVKVFLNKNRPSLLVMVNTGRSLNYIKDNSAKLENLPIDYLSTYNGSELYHNEKSEPSHTWVHTLTPHLQVAQWKNTLEQLTNWSADKVRNVIDKIGQTFSFAEFGQNIELTTKSATDPKYYLKAPTETLDTVSSSLKAKIHMALRELGIHVREETEEQKTSDSKMKSQKHAFLPLGYDKAKPIEFVLAENPDISHIITAGNDINDTAMLKPKHFGDKPNHALICGKKDVLRQALQDIAHCRYLHHSEEIPLSQGLKEALAKIQKAE